jgi:putative transposase
MDSIAIAPEERKSLIVEMKREARPSRRLRMHIALLAADGLSPTEISRVLFCSRTTLYAVASRFLREGHSAFDDRRKRGPRPLLSKKADQRVERLLEEDSPTSHGWLRSRWSCKLIALQLLRECAASASRETLRRALHRLGFRWRRPRPVPPEKDSEEHIEQKRARLEDVLQMTEQEAGSFFQDETKLETNPKVGFCWMRKGEQKLLPTPGTNRKVWISGALNFKTGRFHWVSGGAGTASFSSGCSTNSGEPTPLPQTTAPCGGQRLKPHQQTGEEIRGGLGGSRQSAPFAFVVSREQSGGGGVVVSARSG